MSQTSRDKHNECHHCEHKRNVPGNTHIQCINPSSKIKGDPHGRRNGWFFYPFLFDPTWKLTDCENFKEKETE